MKKQKISYKPTKIKGYVIQVNEKTFWCRIYFPDKSISDDTFEAEFEMKWWPVSKESPLPVEGAYISLPGRRDRPMVRTKIPPYTEREIKRAWIEAGKMMKFFEQCAILASPIR